MTRRQLLGFAASVLCCVSNAAHGAARDTATNPALASTKSPPAGTERAANPPSLDDLLLKGLGPVSRTRPAAKGSTPAPSVGAARRPPMTPNNPPRRTGALASIGRNMRHVQQRLSKNDLSTDTLAVEQQIVADLDQLIAQLQKQCCQSAAQQAAAKSRPGNSDKAKPKPNAKPGHQAARNNLGSTGAGADATTRDGVARPGTGRVWGQLPARFRRQVENINHIEFLPKYRKLIEDYYRRLAEEPNQ